MFPWAIDTVNYVLNSLHNKYTKNSWMDLCNTYTVYYFQEKYYRMLIKWIPVFKAMNKSTQNKYILRTG